MLTLILPMYNAENTIITALESVRKQTFFSKIREIVIINDGSKDRSEEVVKAYMEQWREMPIIYVAQENKGAAAARNVGLRMAKTKYVAFLDADDCWMPNKIERQLQIIKENPEIRFLGTAWDEKPLKIGWKKIDKLYNGTVKDVCIKNFPATPSVLMETDFREKVGYFDETRRYAEDINYFQKIAALGNYYFLPEKLVEIDLGKDFFAQKGLSSHLRDMHKGTVMNIAELRKRGNISNGFWLLMRIFYQIKYYRRRLMRVLIELKKG